MNPEDRIIAQEEAQEWAERVASRVPLDVLRIALVREGWLEGHLSPHDYRRLRQYEADITVVLHRFTMYGIGDGV